MVTIHVIQPGRPWMPIESFQAELRTTKGGVTWAFVPHLAGRKFKVGATAFLTLEAAEKRRLGKAAQVLQPKTVKYLMRTGNESVIGAAARQLPPTVYMGQVSL